MKIFVWCVAIALAMLGLLFVLSAGQGNATVRIVVGIVCWVAAGGLIGVSRLRPIQETHVHRMQVDLPGDVSVKKITCQQCGAELSSDAIKVAAGALYVHCQYCGAEYQLEEAPKW